MITPDILRNKFNGNIIDTKTGKLAGKEVEKDTFSISNMLKVAESVYQSLLTNTQDYKRRIEQPNILLRNGITQVSNELALNLEAKYASQLDVWIAPLLRYLPGHHGEEYTYVASTFMRNDWENILRTRAPKEVINFFQATLNVTAEHSIVDNVTKAIADYEPKNGKPTSDQIKSVALIGNLYPHDREDYMLPQTRKKILDLYGATCPEYVLLIAKNYGSRTSTQIMRKYVSDNLLKPEEIRNLQTELKQYPETRN